MEFAIIIGGKRYGTVKFEVDPSLYEPFLARLAIFGIGMDPLSPQAPAKKGGG